MKTQQINLRRGKAILDRTYQGRGRMEFCGKGIPLMNRSASTVSRRLPRCNNITRNDKAVKLTHHRPCLCPCFFFIKGKYINSMMLQ